MIILKCVYICKHLCESELFVTDSQIQPYISDTSILMQIQRCQILLDP